MIERIKHILVETKLHHVGIISPSETQALEQMAFLGLKECYRGYVETWNVLCIFTQPNGAIPLEFVIPERGPLKDFNGGVGGLHHFALAVPNLVTAMQMLSDQGIKTLESVPVKGAGPFLCNFLEPVYTRGFILELVQELNDEL